MVAIGVASDGSLLIQDPNPFFGRTSLADYLPGFTSGGATWTGEVRGAVHFAVAEPQRHPLSGGGAVAACRS